MQLSAVVDTPHSDKNRIFKIQLFIDKKKYQRNLNRDQE